MEGVSSKHCTGCKTSKAIACFSKDSKRPDGRQQECKDCNKSRYLQNREAQIAYKRDYAAKNPEKRKEWRRRHALKQKDNPTWKAKRHARFIVRDAIKRGDLVRPNECEGCREWFPTDQIQAHHADYDQPLAIEWLCGKCHGARHRTAEIRRDTDSLVAELFPGVAA